MKVRRSVLKDQVTVRPRIGEGSYGDTYADPVAVPCIIDETRRVVRDTTGQQVVSEATLTLHPHTKATAEDGTVSLHDPMELFAPESEVLIDERTSRVITAKRLKLRSYVTAVEVTCA